MNSAYNSFTALFIFHYSLFIYFLTVLSQIPVRIPPRNFTNPLSMARFINEKYAMNRSTRR
jgi:hypothetical protein